MSDGWDGVVKEGGGVGASPLFALCHSPHALIFTLKLPAQDTLSLLFPDLLRGVEASAGEGRWGHAFECGRTHAQGQSSAVLAHGVALARMGEGHSKEKKKAMHVQSAP
jgi:hypothetical protein